MIPIIQTNDNNNVYAININVNVILRLILTII